MTFETDEWGRYMDDDHSDDYRQSRCKKGGFCTFDEIAEDNYVQKEICTKCARRVIYRVVDGRVDNQRYLREHVANFAQSRGKTEKIYQQVYGDRSNQ
jgi:predicted metal-dependent phosphotriesterase family hydrolase